MAKANSCLDMMMRLRVEDLSELKEAFDSHEGGVDLCNFVSVLLDKLEWTDATVVSLIYELIELFHEIAILRHGKMLWDDFTSALIDVGMRTSVDELAWRDWRYEENSLFTDDRSRQPRCVQYIPELKRIFAFESSRPVIQVFDPSAILAAESGAIEQNEPPRTGDQPTTPAFTLPLLHELHPLCYQHGYRKDQDQVRSERSPVQVIKYLASVDLLVIAAGDLKLTFWQPNALFMTEAPEPVYVASTEHPQRVLEWAPAASRLFSLATDNAILVWRVVAKSKKSCSAVCTDVLRSHKDMAQDLLLVNDETLVSCGMDSLIKIWDPASLECKSTRRGHKRGVRKLVKHSDSVFVSTGFERDMLGWDVSGLSIAPIFKLSGHTSPILCIQTIPQLGQAISLDDEGYFKWWNMTSLVSMDDNDRCLQTFRFGNGQYPWKPNAFTLFTTGATILASGFHLKWIHRVRLKPKHYASSAILLNTTTMTLLTTTDRDVQIWDAQKGTLLHVFRGLCRSDITHVVLDARERKFVLSTLGGDVLVFNYLNGALLKSFPRHSGQVSCMLYCKEDEVVLTASWDRSLRLYDDDSKKPLMRCIAQAHRADIKCMAYSYHLGLVATGSADGSLKIWDYVYFLLEQAYSEHSVEVNAVAFLDPHPIVLSGYENGMIVLHSVRPAAHPTRLCQFSIDSTSPTASVATLDTLYDPFGGDAVAEGITSGRQLVYVGDSSGMLRCWDLYPVLRQHQIAAADESLLPHTSKSYNPRRRIERDGDDTAATVDRTTSAPIVPAPPVTSAWQAHAMAIKCVTLVESPVACILTCAIDKTTKVWSLDGTLLGVLGSATWHLAINTTDAAAQKWAHASALWDDLKAVPLIVLFT
ncbi:hypothetical protein SPRG_13526 [Saprolegnia parasitica CBS 223.65]|uniref:Uncharacterized protein n=1 Tax=Saprolegnia parasitica (strain CBS 223.65) TaxID=695850 RepID=A0A067BQL7_SAPPC|nr:hypothetical protein SPRG_13526 [Saprolegnia parasitica CBS 223.65]KDO20774.1 hypothetical protein SPRG_13526 [Saprolegnia parasitica CBS 223.65]|eukprot:XP_012208512.1 hypothetical protein SPRG_13526 [Saprolegnia parasitica CBS 223.65]